MAVRLPVHSVINNGTEFSFESPVTPSNEMAKVHCEGVNSCKSHGDCKGENGCKGKNSCKGKGFLEMTQEECDAAKAKMKDEMMKQ